ncbi:MAG: site-2 protease family protein [archaeon]
MKSAEIRDLLISWLTIALAFSILMSRDFLDLAEFAVVFPIALVTVGTGFVFHEMAHRTVARRFGKHAEYRAWRIGLIFAILSSFVGFIFAAPGAVYIYGNVSRKQNGLISVAGPATNIGVALFFAGLMAANMGEITNAMGAIGMQINMFLALFNLIPFGPLDGGKVFMWSKTVWIAAFGAAFAGTFLLPMLF